MNVANTVQLHGEELRWTKLSCEVGHSGARNVILRVAASAPTNEELNAAVNASAARPCYASG